LAPEWAIFRLVVGGRFLPNFDLANVISTYTKDFSWKKGLKLIRFRDILSPKSPEFYDKFQ
jgi:hypothetical protein